MKQKIVCKNVTRRRRQKVTRICKDKYRHMYNFKVKGYFRDDEKACYKDGKGIDHATSRRKCGWYLNDKEKLSNDFKFINKENDIVWRQN